MKIKVLIACEFSGVVRRAFNALPDFEASSCDLLPAEDGSVNHYQGDVREILHRYPHQWDLMIAHPPCTFLCNSGVRWLHTDPTRWNKLDEAAGLFRELLNAPVEHIAIENPVMHKYAVERIGCKQDQSVQPWQFGHGECKRTCFWLKNLPLLQPSEIVEGREQKVWKMSPSPDRWKLRSTTYPGIARAIANQWGQYVLQAKQSEAHAL